MTVYEYRVSQIHPTVALEGSVAVQEWLNEMSKEFGWRFVAALPTGNPNAPVSSMFVFERPVPKPRARMTPDMLRLH